MPKISIYVSDEMKARMDSVDERANWSSVAQRAFDLELDHLESVKETKSMTDVIERLRASKERWAENLQQDGRGNGVTWAKHQAEYDELKRAAEININDLYQNFLGNPDEINRGWVTRHILGYSNDHDLEPDEVAGVWGVEEEAIDIVVTTNFIHGFLEGASDVWDEIADQL